MTSTTETEIPPYPSGAVAAHDPAAHYAELRPRGPVFRATLRSGRPAWVVTGYEEARQLLTDSRISSDDSLPGYPGDPMPPEMQPDHYRYVSMIRMDPPAHTLRRQVVIPDFTVRRMQTLQPVIQRIVDERVAEILAGGQPADLVAEISVPVSFRVACALLGVSDAERGRLEQNSKTMSESRTLADAAAAVRKYLDYLDELVAASSREPKDNLLGRLVTRSGTDGGLSHDDLVAMVGLLLGGGPASAVHVTSYGLLTLLEHPEQRDRIMADPALLPGAVEEVLRYASYRSGQQVLRTTHADIDIAGVRMAEGDAVVIVVGAANGDSRIFADPDRFDVSRDGRNHIAFGHGVHQCVAQNLGRIQLQAVIGSIFAGIPGLRLAVPPQEVQFTPGPPFSVAALPVTW